MKLKAFALLMLPLGLALGGCAIPLGNGHGLLIGEGEMEIPPLAPIPQTPGEAQSAAMGQAFAHPTIVIPQGGGV